MEQVVYADILLVVNFIINYMLLLFSAVLSGRAVNRRKLILSALLGAVSAFIIFCPSLGFWSMLAYKLAVAGAMVWIGFAFISLYEYLKEVFIFFTVSFLLAGICVAIWMNTTLSGFLCYNGVTYFNVDLLTLMISVSIAYVCITIYSRVSRRAEGEAGLWDATVTLAGKEICLRAFVDTGNSLTEPFSGYPVAVVGIEDVLPALDENLLTAVLSASDEERERLCVHNSSVRLVPCSTVSGRTVLVAVRPDAFVLRRAETQFSVENCYLAISPQSIGSANYSLLISGDFIKIRIN